MHAKHIPVMCEGRCGHAQFAAVLRGGYAALLNDRDRSMLPLLARFQQLTAHTSSSAVSGHLRSPAVLDYYSCLIDKYIPGGALRL